MIGIVIPAHNEAGYIGATLSAVRLAAAHADLGGEPVRTVVVLDSCSDATATVARQHDVCTLEVSARNVGRARAAGAQWLLDEGARWLAFTDADTIVSPQWLVHQLALDADAVCGSVGIDDWSPHAEHDVLIRTHFERTYTDADGHRHIHGANLGVSAEAYRRVGGFAPLACSEDVALVAALEQAGARIAWSAAPRVATSARRDARARGGFGDALLAAIAAGLAATEPPLAA
ncbi:glycosyltransferase [Variovorax sp. J22G21]|uniref:glycosyltransferase n=1 Tax=Variovorax fucosicus TaxID=3053517 RepID=UPI0025752A20|nr:MULTISPECIES: glycosyltransferase [unclassified Variovorax]MDM0042208.1 glycosyltransferase [Variovorax sp. J22R193]MDM0058118.1 glycosyltransferase [Variovorax sp. J22G47]MDM0060812.1 glycosyltransferase [Variovorax sp. J22G21]